MWKCGILIAVVLCLVVSAELRGEWAAGPPAPVPYKAIPDPPDDAERHIVVKATDRGDVWLMTGFLHGWFPDISYETIARVKPKHWREGAWPFWHPAWARSDGDKSAHRIGWSQWGSPVFVAEWLETVLALRGHAMPVNPTRRITPGAVPMTYQMYYGNWFSLGTGSGNSEDRVGTVPSLLKKYRDSLHLLVKYAKLMDVPIDYWEPFNEPKPGPYEGLDPDRSWVRSWDEVLTVWDAAYEAIRSADPEAKIVGPSYGRATPEMIEPFLAHCKEKGQKLDVLSWHELSQNLVAGVEGGLVEPDKAHKNIEAIRKLVDSKYPMLDVEEIHIDEWGDTVRNTGPGTQIAFFYYLDLAGVHRAAKASYGRYLDGLLIGRFATCPCGSGKKFTACCYQEGVLINQLVGSQSDSAPWAKTKTLYHYSEYQEYIPRTSYWAWVEYAKQEGGVRLETETDDRCVVMLASRDDEAKEMRALLARSKRDGWHSRGDDVEVIKEDLPPVKVKIDFEGVPISGRAELTVLKLGPGDGPMWEVNLPKRTEERIVTISNGALELKLDSVAENQVYSIRIAPVGTAEKEKAAAKRQAKRDKEFKARLPVNPLEQHLAITRRAQKAADAGIIRISCGATLAFVDPAGNAWFADQEYEEGSYGFVVGGTIDRGPISIAGTDNRELYSTELWAQRYYKINLPNGKYLLRLHFAEVYRPIGPGQRVFDIVVEGKVAFKDFEALREAAGYNNACVKEVEVEVNDGVLDIGFPSAKGHTTMINGIEMIRWQNHF